MTVFRGNLSSQEQNVLALLIIALKNSSTDYRENVKRQKAKDGLDLPDAYQPPAEKLPDIFEFKLSELASLMNLSPSAISQSIKETITTMMSRVIEWPSSNGDWELESLIGPSKYIKGKGLLQVQLHQRTKAAILDETRGVGFVDLDLFMAVKGAREKRILDLICKFRNDRNFTMKFSEFEKVIGVSVSEFERGLKDFRYSVLERPLKRIFAASDGIWEPLDEKGKGYELVKEGRAVKKIIFKVKYTDPDALKETTDLFLSEQSTLDVDNPVKQPFEYTLPGMEDKIRTFTKMNDAVMMHLIAYEATAKNEGYKVPAEIVARIKMLRK